MVYRVDLNRCCVICKHLQVFATYAADDYDRRNDSVNPIAASAEYELEKRIEKMDLFTTEINKGLFTSLQIFNGTRYTRDRT